MPLSSSAESALARWLALGATSRTHPVLRHACQSYFEPLGIEADWLEAEPFSALESGSAEWWLREARWNPMRLDRKQPAAADFEFLLAEPERQRVEVEPRGTLSIRPASERSWAAVRRSLRASQDAEAFIFMAAGLVLVDESAARLFDDGEDDAFCESVRACLETAPPAARS